MKVRIVVANENEANFFNTHAMNAPLQFVSKLQDDKARLHDRDLETDRPGTSFDRVPAGRHAMDGERSTQRQQQLRLAHRIAEEIGRCRHERAFDRLVIMAGPRMLGLIRAALPDTSRSSVAAEVPKDFAPQLDAQVIKNYIPAEVFHSTVFTSQS